MSYKHEQIGEFLVSCGSASEYRTLAVHASLAWSSQFRASAGVDYPAPGLLHFVVGQREVGKSSSRKVCCVDSYTSLLHSLVGSKVFLYSTCVEEECPLISSSEFGCK